MGQRDHIKTLYLDSNGYGPWMIQVDTLLRGILGYGDGASPPGFLKRFRKVRRYFGWLRDQYESLSYIADWREAFRASPRLDVTVCNINNLVEYAGCLRRIRDYDLIVVSHAAAGDDMRIMSHSTHWLNRRRGKLVMFIGNEYALMDEKIAFMRNVRADMVCSQLPLEAAQYLYGESGAVKAVAMPHALNPKRYRPIRRTGPEIADIGFIGDIYWPFIGDHERTDFIEWFEREGSTHGLTCDIRRKRVGSAGWCKFLNGCKAIVGAESGTYYLNDRGKVLNRARRYNLQHPDAGFDEIFNMFYRDLPKGVSGKAISSRHFEPIGTKTCQVLMEGRYNGLLDPDIHYISVKRDLSNVGEAILRLKDETYRRAMVEQAYDHVMSAHTYAHRVDSVIDLLS
jgi:hypothetical protein